MFCWHQRNSTVRTHSEVNCSKFLTKEDKLFSIPLSGIASFYSQIGLTFCSGITLSASQRSSFLLYMHWQDVVGQIAHHFEFCRCTIKCALALFPTLVPLCLCVASRSAETSSAQQCNVTQILLLRKTLTSIEGTCSALVAECCCF